jgi:hypothetical protein
MDALKQKTDSLGLFAFRLQHATGVVATLNLWWPKGTPQLWRDFGAAWLSASACYCHGSRATVCG